MTSLAQRQTLLPLVDKACHDGARLEKACRQIGLSARTVQRWQRPDRQQGDRRMAGQRAVVCPANQLSEAERQAALDMLNSDEFKDLPPSQIVPRLADRGKYVASESTLYRLLRRAGLWRSSYFGHINRWVELPIYARRHWVTSCPVWSAIVRRYRS